MKQSVGIDVSKEKLDICWLRDASTGKRKTKVFTNNQGGYQKLVVWLKKNLKDELSELLITLEPTAVYHEALMYFLDARGFKLFLANPGKARKYADSQNLIHKTDKSDAAMLAFYGYSQTATASLWQPEAQEIRELKAMMRRLDALQEDCRREENRLGMSETSGASERVLQSIRDMIAVLTAEMDKLKKDIDDHIDGHPELKRNRALLERIQGIGEVLSRELVCLFAAKRFKNAKQVAAYLGLIPKFHESGKLKGRTTLSKQGPARLRAKLYMAAIAASTWNPDIVVQKQRLLNAGKTKMQALCAAMRKLVQICFGVVKHQSEYRPQIAT